MYFVRLEFRKFCSREFELLLLHLFLWLSYYWSSGTLAPSLLAMNSNLSRDGEKREMAKKNFWLEESCNFPSLLSPFPLLWCVFFVPKMSSESFNAVRVPHKVLHSLLFTRDREERHHHILFLIQPPEEKASLVVASEKADMEGISGLVGLRGGKGRKEEETASAAAAARCKSSQWEGGKGRRGSLPRNGGWERIFFYVAFFIYFSSLC